MACPLQGIRVFELTHVISGSVAGMLLGDLGAEVIKAERPGVGEFYREEALKNEAGISIVFPTYNRNKKGITLNLKAPEAREIVHRLVRESDIMLENYRPGVLDSMGLGYEALKEINPRLVMVSISGFGQTGPYASKPAYDMTISAISGFMSMNGPPGQPTKNGPAVSDFLSGIYGCLAAMAALRHRDRTGEGQHVDVSMMDCGMSLLDAFFAQYRFTGVEPKCCGNRRDNYAPVNAYPTADGYIYIAATLNKHWTALAKTMGRGALAQAPENETGSRRKSHEEELEGIVAQWAKGYTTVQLVKMLEAANVPCAPVQSISQVMEDPQVKARQSILEFEYPGLGSYPVTAFVPKFSTIEVPKKRAPLLGENNEEVYCGMLGYTHEQFERLKQCGTV